jgi:hypothetical protein
VSHQRDTLALRACLGMEQDGGEKKRGYNYSAHDCSPIGQQWPLLIYPQCITIVNDFYCKLYFQGFNFDHARILQRTPEFKSYCLPGLFADENLSSSHLMA